MAREDNQNGAELDSLFSQAVDRSVTNVTANSTQRFQGLVPEVPFSDSQELDREPGAAVSRPAGRRTRRRGDETRGLREGRPRSERRKGNRAMRLPDDRVCPLCGDVVPESRRWVVLAWTMLLRAVCCRRCFFVSGQDRDACVRALDAKLREGRP